MQPSYTMGKAVSQDDTGGNEKPTFVDAERDASRSENGDGVSGNEIGNASIDKEAGIINEGGYPPVVEQPPAWSWIRRARES